jgi:peroxin-2
MSSVNFAAAQERVLERRRQRELEAQSRLPDPATRLPPAVSQLPYPLSSLPARGLSLWDTVKGRDGTRPAFRVGQVDAELLDEELLGLLKGQVGEGLKYFGVSPLSSSCALVDISMLTMLMLLASRARGLESRNRTSPASHPVQALSLGPRCLVRRSITEPQIHG